MIAKLKEQLAGMLQNKKSYGVGDVLVINGTEVVKDGGTSVTVPVREGDIVVVFPQEVHKASYNGAGKYLSSGNFKIPLYTNASGTTDVLAVSVYADNPQYDEAKCKPNAKAPSEPQAATRTVSFG